MCFSAEASLVAGASLLAGGGYAGSRAARTAPALIPIAVYPVAFGVQQVVEGALWLDLAAGGARAGALALGFLFFSHFFWPFWAPFSIYWLRRRARHGRLLLLLAALGAVVGALLFIPLLVAGAVPVGVADGHIAYATAAVYDGSVPPNAVLLAYAVVVLVPFALAGRRSLQAFGGLLLLSMVAAYAFYAFTFISVWCFFAAVISAYVVVVVARQSGSSHRRPAASARA